MPNRFLSKTDYARLGGRFCPVCLHRTVEYSSMTFGSDRWQQAWCATCQAEWQDEYKLAGFVDLVAPPSPPRGVISHVHCTVVIADSDGHQSLLPVDFLVLHEYGRLTEEDILRYARDIMGFGRIHEHTRTEVL